MLSSPVELTRVQRTGNASFRAAVAEMQGWRNGHEDAHDMCCNGDHGSFWVLDGHGGDASALHCAPKFGKTGGELLAKNNGLPKDDAINDMFETVDADFRAAVTACNDLESGSTVVGALISKGKDGRYSVKFANAGDSRGLIIADPRKKQEDSSKVQTKRPPHLVEDPPRWPLITVTIDHKPDYYSEKARIEAAGGFVSTDDPPRLDGNLAVSRGVGDFEYKADADLPAGKQKVSCIPDMYEAHGLEEGTIVVLACDGLWDVMTEEQVASVVRHTLLKAPGADLGVLAAKLVHKALEENSRDNVTCMVVQLADGSTWSSKSNRYNSSDEMMYYGKMLAQESDGLQEECRRQYQSFLRKCRFSLEPVQCAVTGRWFSDMYACPGTNNLYMSRHYQKKGWARTKLGQPVRPHVPLCDQPDTW